MIDAEGFTEMVRSNGSGGGSAGAPEEASRTDEPKISSGTAFGARA
jgi:hypothetical protein